MDEGKQDFSLVHLFISLLVIGAVAVGFLFGNPAFPFLFCLFLLFLIPISLQMNKNRDNPNFVFRSLLLLVFPILLFFSLVEFRNCSGYGFLIELLIMAAIPFFLMNGKGVHFNLVFQLYYILLVFSLSVVLISMPGPPGGAWDAKIKATINQMRSAAELSRLRTGSYAGIVRDNDFTKLRESVRSIQTGADDNVCIVNRVFNFVSIDKKSYVDVLLVNRDGSKWCYKAELRSDAIPWCADSDGYVGFADEGGCVGENYSCKVVGL